MQKGNTSYAVKIELSFIDNSGHENNYNETVAICTNIMDARSIIKAVSNAYIVKVS